MKYEVKEKEKKERRKTLAFQTSVAAGLRYSLKFKKKERFCLGRCKETRREDTGGSISYKR